MKYLYLDSSVLVALALDDPKRSPRIQKMIPHFDIVGTSELAVVECQAGISTQLSELPQSLVAAEQNLNQILARMTLFSVGSLILGSARSLVKRYRTVTGLRSLDAIHIATANLIREGLSSMGRFDFHYVTADRRQHATFTAEGYLGDLFE